MNKKYFKDLKRAVELFPNMFIQAKEVVSALGSKDIPDDEPEKKINSIEVGDLRQVKGTWRECVDPVKNIWKPFTMYKQMSSQKVPDYPSSDDFKTFDEWLVSGRVVMKGEKFLRRNKDGVCLFHINQTEPKPDTKNTHIPPHLREDFDEDDWTKQP